MCIILFWTSVGTFSVCEFGQQLSATFEEINRLYDRLAWYRFPRKTQRMLTTQLMFAQKSVELCVFGTISCSRITFKNVRTAFILRQITFNHIKLNSCLLKSSIYRLGS